jgi:hypothetical protein
MRKERGKKKIENITAHTSSELRAGQYVLYKTLYRPSYIYMYMYGLCEDRMTPA